MRQTDYVSDWVNDSLRAGLTATVHRVDKHVIEVTVFDTLRGSAVRLLEWVEGHPRQADGWYVEGHEGPMNDEEVGRFLIGLKPEAPATTNAEAGVGGIMSPRLWDAWQRITTP